MHDDNGPMDTEEQGTGMYKASSSTQFRAILWRSLKSLSREPLVLKIRLIQTVVRTGIMFLYVKDYKLYKAKR